MSLKECDSIKRKEKDLKKTLSKTEAELKVFEKKYSKSKKYINELESQLIKKDD
jgi:septal ring factor EnvC (AmiA/AmiB activator)